MPEHTGFGGLLIADFLVLSDILPLTLKMPKKTASENVVCLCHLLNILANFSNLFCIQANSVDPDHTAPRDAD